MASMYLSRLICDGCAEDIKDRIWLKSKWGTMYTTRERWETVIGYDDETMYDSANYPKHCDDDEDSGRPDHCTNGADCVNAQELAHGGKVGYFFGISLTGRGAEYVRNAVRRDIAIGCLKSVACTVWMPFYDYIDYEG